MKINIKKFDESKDKQAQYISFEHSIKMGETVLNALHIIKEKQDQTLTYRYGCESGICGSCAVSVNGIETLACKTKIQDNDNIAPLKHMSVIKDLVVNLEHEHKVLQQAQTFLHLHSQQPISTEDEKRIERQSSCILCQSCYSSCPVYTVNKNFIGPYALTRALRYIDDKKESNNSEIIDGIQKDGVWDCTLCGNCTMVCPQFIDPKTDIMNLRMKSVQSGYQDPNMQDFSSLHNEFGGSLNGGFDPGGGFNPNGA